MLPDSEPFDVTRFAEEYEFDEEDVAPALAAKAVVDDQEADETVSTVAADEVHKLRVRRRVVGRRLDRFLHGRYPRVSRTTLQKLIKGGQITVNGMPTKASYEPHADDIVQLVLPPPPPSDV